MLVNDKLYKTFKGNSKQTYFLQSSMDINIPKPIMKLYALVISESGGSPWLMLRYVLTALIWCDNLVYSDDGNVFICNNIY